MQAKDYDAWYQTPRGSWIGEQEYRLLRRLLQPTAGQCMIDVGCGTGYFTRRFAADGVRVSGVDPDAAMISYAQSQKIADESYLYGDARALPFPDRSFDYCIAVASLCFIQEQELALAEMVRVTRKRIAIGFLNRNSLLYWQKGRHGGSGAYCGAHWHTPAEVRRLFHDLPVSNLQLRSAIYLPGGNRFARAVDACLQQWPLIGGFLVAAADIG
ncbi:SAM-dependent methyltransferase [Sulfuriferula sp. AH1]|uniref:class I SAM-dependent methyltransferase n=1 Tax=Sulfuriferula sp. AH1 TaxID=1985873 RepID=UPI000B3B5ED7|nr:class I SAM-dependent methyltransferase [Sulfuriferula sp. AH1]ARU31469.1 SAM-dependent methyltransferase [Sulfuriferula sp. AH1]